MYIQRWYSAIWIFHTSLYIREKKILHWRKVLMIRMCWSWNIIRIHSHSEFPLSTMILREMLSMHGSWMVSSKNGPNREQPIWFVIPICHRENILFMYVPFQGKNMILFLKSVQWELSLRTLFGLVGGQSLVTCY